MLRAVAIFSLSLILATFLACPAWAQPDPGDDPNEYENQNVFTTPVISEFMASNGSKVPLAEGGLQRFLNAVAACAESTSLPLHAREVLKNLADGKFEKLSFLTGILRGLLDKPAEVSRGIRAGSIFMLSGYVWIAVFVGRYHDKPWNDYLNGIVIISPMVVLGAIALIQLLVLPFFRTTASHATFRLAVINAKGQRANRVTLLRRWAIVWLPLFFPMAFSRICGKRK